jgi:hypothetical protein
MNNIKIGGMFDKYEKKNLIKNYGFNDMLETYD